MDEAAMRKAIVAIMMDASLSESEKALKRQALMAGKWAPAPAGEREGWEGDGGTDAEAGGA